MPVNYDEVADTVFAQPKESTPVEPPNKYDSVADELFSDQRTAVSHSLYVADKQEPDRKAQVLKLSNELKLPADLVDRNFDQLSAQKNQRTVSVDQLISKTPGLSRFLQDPDNATLAKDDLHNLAKIEDGVNKLAPKSEGFFSDIARAGRTGYNQLSKSAYALGAAFGKVDIQTAAEAIAEHNKKTEDLRSKMPDYAVQFNKDMAENGGDLNRAINTFVKSYSEMRQGHIKQALIDFASAENRTVGETLDLIYSAGKNPKGLGYATIENLANSFPSMAAGTAAGLTGLTVAGPVGGAAGYLGGAFAGELATEVGSWVDQEMSKRGVDMTNPDAIAAAFRDPNLMNSIRSEAERKGVGTAGVGLLFNALPVLGFGFSKAATGIVSKVARKAGDVGVQMVGESAGEAAGQLAVSKGDITKVDWGEVAQEGIVTVGHSFGEASLGKAFSLAKEGAAVSRRALLSSDPIEAASEVAENIKSANQSINSAKVLSELGEIVKESKLAGRMPEKIKELIGKIDFMGEPQAVYFQTDDFDSYWNKKGLSPAKAAEQILGDGGKAYQEAKEMGQPLKVSLGDFVEKVAPSEEDYNGLLAHARMAPDAMSLTEAREEIKSTPATMQDLAREAKAQSDTQGIAPNETAKAQKESLVNQLKAIGVSDYEASRVGALHEQVMQTFGEGATAKANELLKQYGIQITSPTEVVQLEAGQSVLEQSRDFQREIPLPETVSVTSDLSDTPSISESRTVAIDSFKGKSFINSHTGWQIEVPRKGLGKASSTLASDGNRIAMKNLDKLIESAVYARSESSSTGHNIKYDIFYAPLTTKDKDYLVKITVRDANGKKFYDKFAVEKESPASRAVPDQTGGEAAGGAIPQNISIDEFIQGVKSIQRADPFFQDTRGRIIFGTDRKFNIELFKTRDPSTVLHELSHFYLEVFGDLAQTEGASKRITEDYAKLLNWFGVTDRSQIKVEHHEQFARGFEAYLMEGKAPTLELRKLFATFKAWLVSVYRKASNLNVEMSDEIRGVFDRMIATEAEINKAEKAAGISEPLFLDPKSVGMSDAEAARYVEMIEEARLASEDKVRSELMAIAQKEQDQFHRQKKKEFISQSTDQVSSMPVYKAIDHLRGAVPEGSIPIKIDKQYLIDQYDKAVRDKLPTGITSTTDGVHPDMVAQMYGFESGDDLITAMANMPTKKAMIDQLVSQKMAELTQDPIYTGTVSESAVQAVHNDKLEALKRFELEFMMKYDKKGFKDATKRLIKRLPLSKESRETARRILGDVNVGDIKPHQYMLAERRYAGLSAKAWAAGDLDLSFEHKKKELLNFYMYQESVDAKETIDKTLKQFKKISKSDEDVSKTRDVDMVNAARALLAKFGLDRMDKTPEQYLEQMKQYDPMAYDTMLAIVESVSEGAAPYKRVSYQTFQDLKESVFSIWDLAKTSREIEINGKRVSRDEAIASLSARVDELAPNAEKPGYKKALGKWDKTKMKLLQFRAAMTRVEHWISATDKDFSGPFRTYVFNPIMDGVIKYRSEKKKLIEQYKAHVETHKNLFTTKAIKADDLGFEFKDMAHLLGAVLHSGNTSNLSKLLRGYGWGDINEDGSLNRSRWDAQIKKFYQDGTLTKAHMDFIQGVWDMFEQIKPDLQRSHKQMLGFYFSEVTANEIETPWGIYRGGYAPAKADQLIVEDAKIRAEIESFENMNPSFNFPTSGKGSTMKRVESYAAPLQLDMNLVGSHLDWAMRFAHIEPRVKEVNRIMLNKSFREQLSKLDPNAASDMFIPWLQRVAQQTAVKTSQDSTGKVLDAFSKLVRRNVAMQVMTLNVTNTLQQYTGIIVAMTKVKPRFIRNGLVDYIKDIKGTTKFISESSKWMNQNMTNNVYEAQQAIEQIMLNPSTFDKAKDFATRHQYFLQTAAQNHVNTVVWMGAYNQAIESGQTHDQSVKMADSAVRLTQGSAAVEDISEFETGTATARLFKQFVGYFNMLANLNASEVVKISREVGLKKGAGKLFYVYMMGVAIPAALSEVIVKAMAGKFDEDDDDEYLDDALSIFFGSQARTLTAMTPYVGTYVQTSMNQFNNQRWDDRISLSPAISAIEATTSAPKSVYDAIQGKTNAEKKALRDVLLLIGVASGLPMAPLSKPIGYGLDVKSGKAQPTGPIDFTRGLITGKPGAK